MSNKQDAHERIIKQLAELAPYMTNAEIATAMGYGSAEGLNYIRRTVANPSAAKRNRLSELYREVVLAGKMGPPAGENGVPQSTEKLIANAVKDLTASAALFAEAGERADSMLGRFLPQGVREVVARTRELFAEETVDS